MGGGILPMNYTNNEIPESLLAEIRPQWERILDYYLTRAKHKGHICPHCQNGNGKSGTGIVEKDGTNYIKCFKCGMNGTIFSWVMYIENCNFREAVAHCADILGIPFGEEEIKRHRKLPQPSPPPKEKAAEEEIDLTPIFEEAHKHINETDYPQQRGLTLNGNILKLLYVKKMSLIFIYRLHLELSRQQAKSVTWLDLQ